MEERNLTNKEFDELSSIITETIKKPITFADKNDLERNSVIDHYSNLFKTMSSISSFTNFDLGSK